MSAQKPWVARGKAMRRQRAKMLRLWRDRKLREGHSREYAVAYAKAGTDIARHGMGSICRPLNATAKGWDRNQPTDMRWLYDREDEEA